MTTPGKTEHRETSEKKQSSQEDRIAALEAALAAAQQAAPIGTIPEHGAGVGLATAETWSQAEQENATAAAVRD